MLASSTAERLSAWNGARQGSEHNLREDDPGLNTEGTRSLGSLLYVSAYYDECYPALADYRDRPGLPPESESLGHAREPDVDLPALDGAPCIGGHEYLVAESGDVHPGA